MIERFIKNEIRLKRWRRFKRNRRSVISVWVLAFLLFVSVTAEFWANSKPIFLFHKGSIYLPISKRYDPSVFGKEGFVTNYRELEMGDGDWAFWPLVKWDPYESNTSVTSYPAPPSKDNWFGTDDRGRDVFSRLIYGFRYSFGFSIMVWFAAYLMGISIGAVMGFKGGKIDIFGQRVVEVFECMPVLLILITLVSIFGANLFLLVGFSFLFGWMMISNYMRAEFLKLRKRDFVDSARAQGAGSFRILFVHILPNALGPIVTFSPFTIAGQIYALSALDYLGLGLPPPTPSWGELLQQAQNYFTVAWWLAIFTSMALVITMASLNFVGEGVRDAFDPRKN